MIRNVPPDATQRQTRGMSNNHGDVRLQQDEDNALVVSDDEDETSQRASSSSNGSEGEGIALGSDSSDTLIVSIVFYIKMLIQEYV